MLVECLLTQQVADSALLEIEFKNICVNILSKYLGVYFGLEKYKAPKSIIKILVIYLSYYEGEGFTNYFFGATGGHIMRLSRKFYHH